MKTDRELLELAAKAAGYVVRWYEDTLTHGPTFGIEVEPGNPCGFEPWNPLTDDGDALRLAVKLLIDIHPDVDGTYAESVIDGEAVWASEFAHDGDFNAATRRAIVRAAAAIGESMQ